MHNDDSHITLQLMSSEHAGQVLRSTAVCPEHPPSISQLVQMLTHYH